MKIAVIGTGYVGSVTGACLAEKGNRVICMDNNPTKVASLNKGLLTIYEPGLPEIVKNEMASGRLSFTTSLEEAMDGIDVIFLCLPTPQGEDDRADLSYVLGAAEDIGKHLKQRAIIVDKSTVPVGTAEKVRSVIAAQTDVEFAVVSNPEFLREGSAVGDFRRPEQIVVGVIEEWAANVMRELYDPFVRRNSDVLMIMDPASAELTKYGINSFLATKISFANELARLAKASGADYDQVRAAVGKDSRIGNKFLFTGPGWGGSCFPKDTRAAIKIGEQFGVDMSVIKASVTANELQKQSIAEEILNYFDGDVKGKKLALWGLAFKKDTDDVRESPALAVADRLVEAGAIVVAFDPQATNNVKKLRAEQENLQYAGNEYDALKGAEALIIATEWDEFSNPDLNKIRELLSQPIVFDARNMLKPNLLKKAGFYYNSLGRSTVDGRKKP